MRTACFASQDKRCDDDPASEQSLATVATRLRARPEE